jgi:hypothetical protein
MPAPNNENPTGQKKNEETNDQHVQIQNNLNNEKRLKTTVLPWLDGQMND